MAAYYLKWMKEKRIMEEEETVEGVFKRKHKVTIQLLHKNLIDNLRESDLFSNLSVVTDEMVGAKCEKTSEEVLIEEGYFKDAVKFGLPAPKIRMRKRKKESN